MARGKGQLGGFQINIKAPEIKIQNEKGHFTSAQAELHRQNRELAQVMQSVVGRAVENNILRKSVSSGRLLRVTMDPKNRDYSWDYLGVGNVDWLDNGIAKYWRTIEEGSAVTWTKRSFLSLELQGLWGTNVATWNRSAAGDDWIGLGGKKSRGSYRQEMYHPWRGSKLPVFNPQRHIRPQHAYKFVADNPDYGRQMLAGAAKFWNRILGTPLQPRGFMGGIYDHGVG